MIEKRPQKRGTKVKVTFSIPVEWLPTPVSVVGDFNDWDPGVNPSASGAVTGAPRSTSRRAVATRSATSTSTVAGTTNPPPTPSR